jgi:hypothetical protein
MMDDEKKLAFVHKMAHLGLQHIEKMDSGGVISAGSAGSNPLTGFASALTAQNSFNSVAPTTAQTVGNQQAGLAGQLQGEAAGGGPNPAQQQLQQNTQANAQTAANQYAANRSLSPGLSARMSGTTGAQLNQQGIGQSGVQQAQQQIAAQQQLQGLTGQEQSGALSSDAINAATSQNNANAVNSQQQGILGGVGQAFSAFGGYRGGRVPFPKRMDTGGAIPDPGGVSTSSTSTSTAAPATPAAVAVPQAAPASTPPSGPSPASQAAASGSGGGQAIGSIFGGVQSMVGKLLQGLVSSGDAKGGMSALAGSQGGKVQAHSPHQQAGVPGDSKKNDTVPALLSPGEVIIDRDTMADPGIPGQMARALAKHIEAKKKGSQK